MTPRQVLRLIMETRDSCAEGAEPPFGPDQAFDDWAADLASEALVEPDLLAEAYSALEALQERHQETLHEALEGMDGYRCSEDLEALASLLERIQGAL